MSSGASSRLTADPALDVPKNMLGTELAHRVDMDRERPEPEQGPSLHTVPAAAGHAHIHDEAKNDSDRREQRL